ncbi:MAG: hypothetical protein ACLQUY_04580 [Ktedonobacterales bacterium]
MAHADPETLETLNALLQDVRASVEVEVALSNGATERAERETLVSMGIEEVGLCCSLRDYLAEAGAFVTRHVNGIVLTIISTEHYDDRLREFALHQMDSGQRAHQLSAMAGSPELMQLLADIHDAHVRSALWSEHRATQFASSRTLEFRSGAEAHSSAGEGGESAAVDDPSGATTIPSTKPYTGGEDTGNWSGDSYRSPAARENYPMDEE